MIYYIALLIYCIITLVYVVVVFGVFTLIVRVTMIESTSSGFIIFKTWVSKKLFRKKYGEISASPSIKLIKRIKELLNDKEIISKYKTKNRIEIASKNKAFEEIMIELYNKMIIDKCYCITTHTQIINKMDDYVKNKKLEIVSKDEYKEKYLIEVKLLNIWKKVPKAKFYRLVIKKIQ